MITQPETREDERRTAAPEARPRWPTARQLLVGVAVIAVAWVIWRTRGALAPFFVGAVIAYLLAPIVEWLSDRLRMVPGIGRVARPLSIVVAYVGVIAVLVVAGIYLVPPVVDQTTQFVADLPSYLDTLQGEIVNLRQLYETAVPESIRSQITSSVQSAGTQSTSAVQGALMATFGAVGSIIGFLAGLALLPLWVFYILVDQHEGMNWFYHLWPATWRSDVRRLVGIIDRILAAYIRGQLLLGVIIGVVTGLALWAIGIPQPLVLGLIAGVFELIPVLGPWLAFAVAAVVTVATDPSRMIFVAPAFLAIQQLENTFLVPKVQGGAVRIHPAFIMTLLAVGGALWGILGMIVIVPVAAILRDSFTYLYHRLGGSAEETVT